jgi:hypothetical protein
MLSQDDNFTNPTNQLIQLYDKLETPLADMPASLMHLSDMYRECAYKHSRAGRPHRRFWAKMRKVRDAYHNSQRSQAVIIARHICQVYNNRSV